MKSYVLVPIGLCSKKIEIMHFEQGKLCVTNVELCAKLCAISNKKELFFFHITYFVCTFIKRVKTKKKRSSLTFVHILTEFYLT